jgi:hypothetical protein
MWFQSKISVKTEFSRDNTVQNKLKSSYWRKLARSILVQGIGAGYPGLEFDSVYMHFIFFKQFEWLALNLTGTFELFLQNFVTFSKFANLYEVRKILRKQNVKPKYWTAISGLSAKKILPTTNLMVLRIQFEST